MTLARCAQPSRDAVPGKIQPLFTSRVPIAAPWAPPIEPLLDDIRRILSQSQWTAGEYVGLLEERAAAFLDVPYCVAVSSCTAGLMLVMRVLGLKGEIILPSFTFCATAHSVLWNGLTPVLVDCEPGGFQLDPERVERAISPRTAAILGVHVFGAPAAVIQLSGIAQRRGLPLLYDGAHAFGTTMQGHGIARWGDATVFSLSPTKPLPGGEGGLIATHDPRLAGVLRQARNYGKGPDGDCGFLGLSARMPEMQAALALAGLPFVERNIARRAHVASLYRSRLDRVPGLRFQEIPPESRSSWKDFAIVLDPDVYKLSRDALAKHLAGHNVETRAYFDPPLHRQRLCRSFHRPSLDPLETTERIRRRILCLPIHATLDDDTVTAIADCIAAPAILS